MYCIAIGYSAIRFMVHIHSRGGWNIHTYKWEQWNSHCNIFKWTIRFIFNPDWWRVGRWNTQLRGYLLFLFEILKHIFPVPVPVPAVKKQLETHFFKCPQIVNGTMEKIYYLSCKRPLVRLWIKTWQWENKTIYYRF